jgi:hypothetical protein
MAAESFCYVEKLRRDFRFVGSCHLKCLSSGSGDLSRRAEDYTYSPGKLEGAVSVGAWRRRCLGERCAPVRFGGEQGRAARLTGADGPPSFGGCGQVRDHGPAWKPLKTRARCAPSSTSRPPRRSALPSRKHYWPPLERWPRRGGGGNLFSTVAIVYTVARPRYFRGPYFISLSNCRASPGVSIRPTEWSGTRAASWASMGYPSTNCDARPNPFTTASSRA